MLERHGVVVVGTGGVADEHFAALRATPRAELVGVVDTAAARAESAAFGNGGAHWTTDLAEALTWPGVDAFLVCTPNHTHAEIGLRIAAAGKHLLVEKPLATTVEDAARMVAAFDDAGRVLRAAHTHRHYDYALAVRDAIAGGAVGRPVFARLAILGGWIWPDWHGWMLDAERSGGHSLHNGVHLLDLATWWFGRRPESVYARGQRQTAASLDIYDHLELVLRFDGGESAVCEMSRGHRPGGLGHRDVLVVGTDGELALPWDGESSLVVDERGTGLLPPVSGNGFTAQLDSWLDAVDGRAGTDAMSAADGAFAVTMGVAAERSIRTGLPVRFADLEAAA